MAGTAGRAVSEHKPIRPQWICQGCGAPWPCAIRRGQLMLDYAGSMVSLSLSLASYFVVACQDLAWANAGDLHHRFLGWTREHPAGAVGYP